jgi:hypothetical protein
VPLIDVVGVMQSLPVPAGHVACVPLLVPQLKPVHPLDEPPEPLLVPLLLPLLLPPLPLDEPPSPKTVGTLSEPHPADADITNPEATRRSEAI